MRRPLLAPIVIVLASVLPMLYVVSYFALVQREFLNDGSCFVRYRLPLVKRAFAPIHWIDGKLRPQYWSCEWTD